MNIRILFTLLCTVACLAACKIQDQEDMSTPVDDTMRSDTVANIPQLGVILRTPDSRFANLKDYPFKANYVFLAANQELRMHYLDEGPKDGKIVLLMHGNPSWVYNFRKLIPLLTQQGFRVICPDLIGFGRSDKPADRVVHTYDNQVKWVEKFIQDLNLTQIHLSCQDWGGLIGLRVAALNQSRFAKIVISNTTLPDGTNVSPAFRAWRVSSQTISPYSSVLERSTFVELDSLEEKAYDAPFPAEKFKAAPRELPLKVPIDPKDQEAIENQQYWQTFKTWPIPILTIFSEEDNISPNEELKIQRDFLGAQGQNHLILKQASHFIREDQPTEMALWLGEFFKKP